MPIDFEHIAPYLQDPLILIGFFLLLGFLIVRTILRADIIPQLTQAAGYRVVQRILLYGFFIAIALIVLGFGLKYRELSKFEQTTAVSMLRHELAGNFQVLSELQANGETLLGATSTVSRVIRTPGIQLLQALFPVENLDPAKPIAASADLARQVLAAATNSGLLTDAFEQEKFTRAAHAIVGTIKRTMPTVRSLADDSGHRYVISSEVWNSQLPILRKIDVVDVTVFQQVYQQAKLARANYNVVVGRCIDYLNAAGAFFAPVDGRITSDSLAGLLASERLYFSVMTEYGAKLTENLERVSDLQGRISNFDSSAGDWRKHEPN